MVVVCLLGGGGGGGVDARRTRRDWEAKEKGVWRKGVMSLPIIHIMRV